MSAYGKVSLRATDRNDGTTAVVAASFPQRTPVCSGTNTSGTPTAQRSPWRALSLGDHPPSSSSASFGGRRCSQPGTASPHQTVLTRAAQVLQAPPSTPRTAIRLASLDPQLRSWWCIGFQKRNAARRYATGHVYNLSTWSSHIDQTSYQPHGHTKMYTQGHDGKAKILLTHMGSDWGLILRVVSVWLAPRLCFQVSSSVAGGG